MGLYELVRSKGYKNFMAKLYGIGAAVVILGALFKILHWPGANYMLMAGMGTESIIFFFSAFEPLHKEFNWTLVYPQLAMGLEDDNKKGEKKKALQGTVTQQLDQALTEAKIGPELLESLAAGMRNIGENAKQLSGMADTVVATDGYVTNLSKASESVRNLTASYDKTAEVLDDNANMSTAYFENVVKATTAVGELASAYENTVNSMSAEADYIEGTQRLSKNLAAINAAYELQLQATTNSLNSAKELEVQMSNASESLAESAQQVIAYKEQVDLLAKNVGKLNDIYGNMLAAMNANR